MRRLCRLAVALAGRRCSWRRRPAAAGPDPATTTPIKHFVFLMQGEPLLRQLLRHLPRRGRHPGRRLPAADYAATTTGCVKPFPIGRTTPADLGDGSASRQHQYDGGRMDGFVAAYRRLGLDGTTAMGHYDGRDLPSYWNVAKQYVLFDRFFGSTAVGSRENYLYWVAGNAPRSRNPLTSSAGYDRLPTIFDRLAAKGISAKFYVENLGSGTLGAGRRPDRALHPAHQGAPAQHEAVRERRPSSPARSSTSASTTATCAAARCRPCPTSSRPGPARIRRAVWPPAR